MSLLEFHPPKTKAALAGAALRSELRNRRSENEALMQGLDNLAIYNDAVLQNLIFRARQKYLEADI